MPTSDASSWPRIRAFLLARLKRTGGPAAQPGAVVRTAVVTDSAAGMPGEWIAGLGGEGRLSIVPMPVMVGEEIYSEGGDDISETIALALARGTSVKTSRPSPGQFEQAYLAALRGGYDGVVSVHISGGLSGTLDAARLAAGRVDIPVEVVDSRTVGMALGMAVQEAVRVAGEGATPESVAAAAANQAATSRVYFYVPSLEQLRRGGRIGAAASVLGTVFAIKPILAVEGGKIVPLEKVRSAARAVSRLEEIAVADVLTRGAGDVRLAVHHFGNPAEAESLAQRLAAALPQCPPAQISALPAVLAAHAGLGVLAVIVSDAAGVDRTTD